MTKLAERAKQLVELFPKIYPGAHCELDFKNPLQLLVATILSAQCTDKRVNLVTPRLFAKYKSAAALARANSDELEDEIRSTGFFAIRPEAFALLRRRSKKIIVGAFPRQWKNCGNCQALGERRPTSCSETPLEKMKGLSSIRTSPGYRCGSD